MPFGYLGNGEDVVVEWLGGDVTSPPSLGPGSPVRELYPSIRDAMLLGEFVPMSSPTYGVAVDGSCVFDPAHTVLDDLPTGCMIGDPALLPVSDLYIYREPPATRAYVVPDPNDPFVFTTDESPGRIVVAVVLFHGTGDPTTSHLISYNGLQQSSEAISIPTGGAIRWYFADVQGSNDYETPTLYTF